MINKIVNSMADALVDVRDGSVVMLGGFGGAFELADPMEYGNGATIVKF